MFVTDPAELSAEQLDEELAAQAAIVDAELCRFVELAAECRRRLPLALDGTTFAGWLAWRCSLSPRQAREHERIGERLEELPLTQEAFSRGEISYAKVSTLTRIAEPESEERLLGLAEVLSASQFARAAGAYQQVTREQAAEQQEREFLHHYWSEDGSLAMQARLAAEDGALVLKALDAAREALSPERRPTNAQSLVAMADLALAHSDRDRSGGERYQVVVHVDAETLAHEAGGRCELDDGHGLAIETARRLSCDGSIVELLERDGEPLALGRKRRTISPALRRALAARDRGCRYPGCTNTRFVHAHHMEHWSRGGKTNLDNLLSLCSLHHRLVHERGYTVHFDDDGEPHFTNRYGIAIPNAPRPPPCDSDARRDRHVRRRLEVDGTTCKNGTGDRMDLGLAVDAFLAA